MPRKRAVKNETSKRPGPALPEGDEGKDMDHEKRREKVVTLMRDFKAEVSSRVRGLKASVNETLNQIDLAYTMEMMTIPPRIRQMPLKEYLKMGGSFEESSAGKLLEDQLASILGENLPGGKCLPLESISESNVAEAKTVRTSRRRQKAGPPQTTARGKALATPATKINLSAATPLFTPKFDPRLYQTPAVQMRVPKPGEMVISMSMDGSPLMDPKTEQFNENTMVVPLKNNKVMVLDGSTDVSQIDVSQIDVSRINPSFLKLFSELCKMDAMDAKLKSITNNSK